MKEIRQTALLSDAEHERLFGWGEDIFEANDLRLRWRGKDVHFLLEIDGQVVSHVGVLKHQVSVGGQSLLVGGVGGVVTIPEEQHHGHARELMRHAVGLFSDWNVDAGLLFCLKRRVPFYESQDWQLVASPVIIEQTEGEISSPLEVMVLPLGRATWPEGEVRLNSFPW